MYKKNLHARANLNRRIRSFFDARDFLEVETPILVKSPGTDIFLAPFETLFQGASVPETLYLQTSPEFAMKELLVEGCERIYQLTKAFRNGEYSERHNIEFTILEWYRTNEDLSKIIEDVRDLVIELSDLKVSDFTTCTMASLFEETCGFDIRDAQTHATLYAALQQSVGLPYFVSENSTEDWNDLFFDTIVRYIDPYLEKLGAVFVTEWPTRLAVLAEKNESDPRVAKRFELYIDGLEIANGFQELRDVDEQRSRFESDNLERVQLQKPPLPIPIRFLEALKKGLPHSAGVALGVDRLLMISMDEKNIQNLLPFSFKPKN